MIRLTVISILVFSGLLFFTGKDSPTQNSFVSFADFQGADSKSTPPQKHNAKTHIDTIALKKTFDNIKIRDYLHAEKNLTVASVAIVKPRLLVVPKKVKKPTSVKKPLVLKKIGTKKSVRYSMILPVRRPMRVSKNNQHSKSAKKKARPPSLLSSFKGFITRVGATKVSSFQHKQPHLKSKNVSRKSRSASNRFKNSAKNIDPRLLTVLIKRELQRLNCYSGVVSAHWDHRIQRSLEATKAPLTLDRPSLKTLTYLESKSSLDCRKSNTRIVNNKQNIPQLKTVVTHEKPAFTLASKGTYSQAGIPTKTAYGFLLRDRTGKIISKKTTKQTAKLSDRDATIEKANQEYALAREGKDYDYARQGEQQYSMRPPAYTVGMRPQQAALNGGTPPNLKKRTRSTYQKKKNNDWKKKIFDFD